MKTQQLFSLVSCMSGVQRFSMLKMVHKETVLEHTGMMACFAFALGTRLNTEEGYDFNMETLLAKAIVHDWDEVITGDVARPTKYFSKAIRTELAALEKSGVDHIGEQLEIAAILSVLHYTAKQGPEGSIVALCDIACAIHRCWEEALIYGNKHFTLPAQRLRKVLHDTLKKAELGQMSHAQWIIVNSFILDLNNILNRVLQCGNGELVEMAHAD